MVVAARMGMTAPRFTARQLLMLAVFAMYALAVVYVVLRLSLPSDGARIALQSHAEHPNSVTISSLIAPQLELRSGDYVISVDGQVVGNWSRQMLDGNQARPAWNVGQTVRYAVVRGDTMIEIPVTLRVFPISALVRGNITAILFLVLLQFEAIWIWSQRRAERTVQVLFLAVSGFCAFNICWYLGTDIPMLVSAPAIILFYRIVTFVMLILMCAAILHFSLILPRWNSQLPLPRQLIVGVYLTPFVTFPLLMALLYHPVLFEWLRRWEICMISLIFASFILALLAFLYGYRRLSHRVPRLHVRIIAFTFAFATIVAVVYGIPIILTGQSTLGWNVLPLLSLPVAFGLGVAVIFYRLFDIRIVIQRTLVWSALTTLILSTYVLIVGGLSLIFLDGTSTEFSLIATGIVAVMFHGVRTRTQTWVNRLLYGERDAPYQVVTRITQQIEAAAEPNAALSQFVRSIGTALKLPYSAVELSRNGHFQVAAAWGKPGGERFELPLAYRGEAFGRLVVTSRASGEALTAGDQELLVGLSYQAEIMLAMARLNAELQTSREKLVVSVEDERRRLRRDLHDGLGPALASMPLQIDAARNLLARDPAQAEALLISLKDQTKITLEDVRNLVYGLRPPALDDLGLIGAIREKVRQFEHDNLLTITLEVVPAVLPPLSAALEVAVYRITIEAVNNVVRHANAKVCSVRIVLNTALSIEVRDDGCGLSKEFRAGVGLHSIEERAAELGGTCNIVRLPEGGTLVSAKLPYIPTE